MMLSCGYRMNWRSDVFRPSISALFNHFASTRVFLSLATLDDRRPA